jgi:hypothetical protein
MTKIKSFTQTFARYAEVDWSTNKISIIDQSLPAEEIYAMEGTFDLLNGEPLALVSNQNENILFYKMSRYRIESGDRILCSRIDEETCKLCLVSPDENIKFECNYKMANSGLIDRIGWTEDEEDYNFGLWLQKNFNPDES